MSKSERAPWRPKHFYAFLVPNHIASLTCTVRTIRNNQGADQNPMALCQLNSLCLPLNRSVGIPMTLKTETVQCLGHQR